MDYWVVLWTAFAAVPLVAQSTADQIVEKYVQAIGGEAAFQKVSTRVMKGEAVIPDDNTTGTVEAYAKAPDRYRVTYNFPGYGVLETVLQGDQGWTKNPDSGVNAMSRTDLVINKRDHSFYWETRIKELYPKIETAGTAQVEGRTAQVIAVTPPQGAAEKLYFDAQSGFLVKHDFERITLEDGIVQNEVLYRDYRDVDGLKLPFTVEQRTPDFTMIVKFSEIRNNTEVGDERFSKPEK